MGGDTLVEAVDEAYRLMDKARHKADEKARFNSSGHTGSSARQLWAIFKQRESKFLRLKAQLDGECDANDSRPRPSYPDGEDALHEVFHRETEGDVALEVDA